MKKILLFSLVFVAALLPTACSRNNPDAGKADYTLIVYGNVGGRMDNLIEDVWAETQALLTDKRVRVFCVHKYGKPDGFVGKYGEPGEVLSFELDKDTRFEDLSGQGTVGKDFPLYEPYSLKTVLNWAKEVAPAKEYVLTLFGHGGGFDANVDFPKNAAKGVLYDDWWEGRIGMDMYELTEAIRESDIPHLKALFFHNCLMGGMESMMEVQPYADYIIATPFLMTSEDNPMIPLLVKNLRAGLDVEKALRNTIIECKDRIINGFRHEDPDDMNGNEALVKSSELTAVCTATRKLTERLCTLYPTRREAIDAATNKAYRFFNRRPYFDLLDYAQALAEETGDAQLQSIGRELENAFGRAILEQITAEMKKETALPAYSLSVVLVDHETFDKEVPNTTHTYRQAYEYTEFHRLTQWGQWLDLNQQLPTGNPCGQVIK